VAAVDDAAGSVASVVAMLVLWPVAALLARIPARAYARALLPSQLIAFSSSSSIATLPSVVESAERLELPGARDWIRPAAGRIGVQDRGAGLVGRGSAVRCAAVWSAARLHRLCAIAFAAVFLSFGVPGIPRGAFILLTPLFVALGLSVDERV
jgi:Na+/H+-dicarboxylate symporter